MVHFLVFPPALFVFFLDGSLNVEVFIWVLIVKVIGFVGLVCDARFLVCLLCLEVGKLDFSSRLLLLLSQRKVEGHVERGIS